MLHYVPLEHQYGPRRWPICRRTHSQAIKVISHIWGERSADATSIYKASNVLGIGQVGPPFPRFSCASWSASSGSLVFPSAQTTPKASTAPSSLPNWLLRTRHLTPRRMCLSFRCPNFRFVLVHCKVVHFDLILFLERILTCSTLLSRSARWRVY